MVNEKTNKKAKIDNCIETCFLEEKMCDNRQGALNGRVKREARVIYRAVNVLRSFGSTTQPGAQ